MQTIAIVNEKGGTAKTTTTVNLSAALGELGKKVLLVDLDGQAASSRWLGVEEDSSLAEALLRGEGFKPLENVIPGVSLAPGSGKLDSVAHDLRPTQGGQLRKLLSQVSGYDYTLIDCPPSLGNRLIGNALLAATHAIVPVETSILALDGLKILLTTIQDVRDGFGHEIILYGVLACRYDARTKLSRFILAELKRALPGKVFKTVIRENVRIRECPASGQSILQYAPDSHAAEDYMALARELLAMPQEGHGPDTEVDHVSASDLTQEEHQAVADMRHQVDAMVQQLGPNFGERTSDPAKPSWESDQEETDASADETAEAEAVEGVETGEQDQPAETEQPVVYELADEPAGAEAGEDDQTTAQDQPTEAEEPVVQAPADEPAPAEAAVADFSEPSAVAEADEQTQTEPQASPEVSLQDDQAWEFVSEERERPTEELEPAQEDGQDWEAAPPETQIPAAGEETPEAAPPVTDVDVLELTQQETADVVAQLEGDQTWDIGSAEEETPSADQADLETIPAVEDLADNASDLADAASADEEPSDDKDYPALRAMLEKMADRDEAGEAGKGGQDKDDDPAWRRIFRKRPA